MFIVNVSVLVCLVVLFCCVCRTIIYSEQHVLLMWSVAFYIAEHFVHDLKELDFVSRLFQVDFFHHLIVH